MLANNVCDTGRTNRLVNNWTTLQKRCNKVSI